MDVADEDGWSSLHLAAEKGHTACVADLLEAGAAVDAAITRGSDDGEDFPTGSTPLHMAADCDTAALLLRHGADPDPGGSGW